MSLAHFNDSNFKQDVMESKVPVMVDFWATWCGPCKMIAPMIEELAKEFSGRMKFGKVNVEESPRTASHYGVMSVPTLIFFKHGKVMNQVVGGMNKTQLKKKIEENL